MSKDKKITITLNEFHSYLDRMYNAGFNSGFFSGIRAYVKRIDELQKDVLDGINDAMSKDVTYQNMKEHPIGEVLNIDKTEEENGDENKRSAV